MLADRGRGEAACSRQREDKEYCPTGKKKQWNYFSVVFFFKASNHFLIDFNIS